jgi:hypothetical protein
MPTTRWAKFLSVAPEGRISGSTVPDVGEPDDVHAVGDVGDAEEFVEFEDAVVVLLGVFAVGDEDTDLVGHGLRGELSGDGLGASQAAGQRKEQAKAKTHDSASYMQ